jgi:adenylate cyclase
VASRNSPEARQQRAQQGADAIEVAFFGETGSLTRPEVEALAGVGPETSERMWRALGFVDAGPDARVFTSADVAALKLTAEIEQDPLVTPGTEETLARALGQSMSRLAQAQVEATGDLLAQVPEVRELASDDPQELVRLLTERAAHLIGPMEKLLVYAWRRHAVAASQRSVMSLLSEMDEIPRAVGFADLVGFTSLARDLPASELAAVVRQFEDTSFEAVLRRGGRVVKTLGDEVMFSADDAVAAADIALTLAEAFGGDDPVQSQAATGVVADGADDSDVPAVPPVRVGLAWGPALAHGGDVLGPVVNIASRCTSLARPGTVLVDRELASQLAEAGTGEFTLVRLRPQRVRGYDHLMPCVLRRNEGSERSGRRGVTKV